MPSLETIQIQIIFRIMKQYRQMKVFSHTLNLSQSSFVSDGYILFLTLNVSAKVIQFSRFDYQKLALVPKYVARVIPYSFHVIQLSILKV